MLWFRGWAAGFRVQTSWFSRRAAQIRCGNSSVLGGVALILLLNVLFKKLVCPYGFMHGNIPT